MGKKISTGKTDASSSQVKEVVSMLENLAKDLSPENVIGVIVSLMKADIYQKIPPDVITRAERFIGLLYKKFDTETLNNIIISRNMTFNSRTPQSLDNKITKITKMPVIPNSMISEEEKKVASAEFKEIK